MVATVGIVVLVGWATSNESLKTLAPGLAPVAPNIAVCLVALSLALGIAASNAARSASRIALATLCSVTIAIGLVTFAEYLLTWNPGLDTLFVTGATHPDNPYPGRMRPVAALTFTFLGIAILLIRSPRTRSLAHALAMVSGGFGLLTLVFLSLGLESVVRASPSGIAVQTALTVMVLSAGVIAAEPPVGLLARLGTRAAPVGFVLSLVTIGTSGFGAYLNSRQLAAVESQLAESQALVLHLETIFSETQGAESGSRAFALTGDTLYLPPVQAALVSVPEHLDALRRAVSGDSAQSVAAARLTRNVTDGLDRSRRNVELRRERGLSAAQAYVASGAVREQMDSVKAGIARMRSAANDRLTDHRNLANVRAAATQVGSLASVGLSATILLVLFSALRREVHDRRKAESDVLLLNKELETRVVRRTAELHSTEVRLQATLDGMMEGAQIIGFDWRYLYVNEVAARHGRRPRSELLGRTMQECYPGIESTQVYRVIEACLTDRTHRVLDNEFPFPDGTSAWFRLSVTPVEEGAFILSMDITERLQAEKALRQAQKMEAVGQLSGGIAHDFNNVLTVIGANAELVAQVLPPNGQSAEDLAEINAAVRRGTTMIAQLLKFSRGGTTTRRDIELGTALTGMTAMLRRLLPESVRVETAWDGRPLMVSADATAIEQMVMNLCTNSRDAMPNGGTVQIECGSAEVSAGDVVAFPWASPGAYARLSVRDSGVGMDEGTRARMFEPFFTTKPPGSGTGLGMAMVYSQMKDHLGLVRIESAVGRGTTVSLLFPLSAATLADSSADVAAEQASPGGSESILLVEDDPSIRRSSHRALQRSGYRVIEAADGIIALEKLQAHPEIALVISDLVMPNMGGRQLAKAMRDRGLRIPLLITSGYADDWVSTSGTKGGAVEFLQKPWTLADLTNRVRTLLDGASG